MRTTTSIEAALPESLLRLYREQLAAVRNFVGNADEDVALPRLEAAMTQTFTQAFGLSLEAARALAGLAARLPGDDRGEPSLRLVIERFALQRALAAAGMAAEVRPSYVVAAEAALAAAGIPDAQIVVHDPAKRRMKLPTLPPVHHQDADLNNAGHSRFFAIEWD